MKLKDQKSHSVIFILFVYLYTHMSSTQVKRNPSALPYALTFIVFAMLFCVRLGGWYTYAVPLLVFGLIPSKEAQTSRLALIPFCVAVADVIIGLDEWNPESKEQEKELSDRLSFRIVTFLWLPFQVSPTALPVIA